MRSLQRTLSSLVGIGLAGVLVIQAVPAAAYVSANVRQLSTAVPYTITTTTYKPAFNAGVTNWNAAQSKVKWTSATSAINTLSEYYVLNTTEYGLTTINGSFYQMVDPSYSVDTADVSVNDFTLNMKSGNFRTSVASHEMGHALGLNENNGLVSSLMNQNRNREIVYKPQQDDIDGVIWLYR